MTANARVRLADRRVQLGLGVLSMVAIASPQYVWALLTLPLARSLGATLPQVQVTFAILIVLQTFFAPIQGVLVDRFGPRRLLSLGAILTAASWMLAAAATTLPTLYLTYGLLGGLGTGIVYVGVIGHMVQWFPDCRGFATGLAAAGYGMGAFLFTVPVDMVIRASTHGRALLAFGALFGAIGLTAAQGLRPPPVAAVTFGASTRDRQMTMPNIPPSVMLRSPIFWLLFVMMTMMSTSGLMVTSQIGAFTADFGMARLALWGVPLLPLALSIDRLTNGATRPFFGWVSDRIGREPTMFIAFSLEAVAMSAWLLTRGNPVLFVLMSGIVFFGWGEIFSLFPATLTDTFGTRHATTNYGFLYMAQGLGSVLGGPVAALLHDSTHSWIPVFAAIIAMDAATAALAISVLRPMRHRWLTRVVVERERSIA